MPRGDFEVIVVDNDSTDQTASVCERFSGVISQFHYVFEQRLGLHNGRHAGLKRARGDVLVYSDDDIEASQDWLEGIREGFGSPAVALVGGPCLPNFESSPPKWFDSLKIYSGQGWWIGSYSLIDLGDQLQEIRPGLVFGCNFGIRRNVLEQIGGFHPDAMPREDIRFRGDGECAVSEAVGALGLRAIYHPKAAVGHLVSRSRLTPEYLRWRAYMQGISDSYRYIRHSGGLSNKERLWGWCRGRQNIFALEVKRIMKRNSPLKRIQVRGHWEGYVYHQREVARDPDLLAWVLKPNYLENDN